MSPHELLSVALVDLAARGQKPPCAADPERWTSDDYRARAEAAEDCQTCAVLAPCSAAGEGEVWGVFGGVDRTPTTRKGAA